MSDPLCAHVAVPPHLGEEHSKMRSV
jgi:hypothetical protein